MQAATQAPELSRQSGSVGEGECGVGDGEEQRKRRCWRTTGQRTCASVACGDDGGLCEHRSSGVAVYERMRMHLAFFIIQERVASCR